MEVSEDDRDRQEHYVARVLPEQANQLDHLGEAKHEDELGPERAPPRIRVPVLSCPPAG